MFFSSPSGVHTMPFPNMQVRVPKSTFFKICLQKICRFRVKGRDSHYSRFSKMCRHHVNSIQLKSLLVAEARGNHPISLYSTNQIAPFPPRDTKVAFRSAFLRNLKKFETSTWNKGELIVLTFYGRRKSVG